MTSLTPKHLGRALLVIVCFLGLLAPASAAAEQARVVVADSGGLTWRKVQNYFCTRERLIQAGAVGLVIGLFLLFRAKGDVS